MSTAQERNDIQTLKTDVALIKQEQKNQTSTLNKVNQKLDNLAFVSQKDYDKEIHGEGGVLERLSALEESVNAGGVKVANAVTSGVGKAIIAALIFGFLALIVWSLIRVNPAIQGVVE